MSQEQILPPPLPALPAPSAPQPSAKVLRRLFLTLFLRGRSSRGLQKDKAPKSVGEKLALVLFFYLLFGGMALFLVRQPVFALAVYLHGMTFVFLGMFVASSAGEVLFNKEESDILLHRPIQPRTLLWAKVRVLIEVSLWLAGAMNLVGAFVGVAVPGGGWLFPLVHALSTSLEALFFTGCVVLVYQLCLRWFGRERLDGLMTTAQVIFSVGAVLAGQVVPRVIGRLDNLVQLNANSWWVAIFPPAWFAGLDDALAGNSAPSSWLLTAVGLTATTIILVLAFGKLAQSYETGLQALNETVSSGRARGGKRRITDFLADLPPLSWWLRNPVERASFKLSLAYLLRDRDVKLRVFPGLAPLFVMPLVLLLQARGQDAFGKSGFGIAFAGSYMGLAPVLGLHLLQFSQQWQASDIFRTAPISGPAPLAHGARRAVLMLFVVPLMVVLGLLSWFVSGDCSRLLLLLPGMISMPLLALVPCMNGKGIPLSLPSEEAKAAGRGLIMWGFSIASIALAGIAVWAWSCHWFQWFLSAETAIVIIAYCTLRRSLSNTKWSPLD